MRIMTLTAGCAALSLGGCAGDAPAMQCPDPAAVAPPSIGTSFITGLSARLAGPDRENTIAEAIAEMHRRNPKLGSSVITDVLIAADCPVAAAQPDHDEAADRARIAGFRAQVDQLLGE
jgi:hypothetical protein